MAEKATVQSMNPAGPQIDRIVSDARQVNRAKAEVDEFAGGLRDLVKAKVETGGYHKGAFSLIARLERMDIEKFEDFDRTFADAYDELRRARLGDSTPDMFAPTVVAAQ